MMKIKTTLQLSIIFIVLSCSSDKIHNDNDEIKVELNKSLIHKIAFEEIYTQLPFQTYKNRYPEYYRSQLKSYDLTASDSVMIWTFNTDYRKFVFELFKAGFIEYESLDNLKIDSLIEQQKPPQKQLIVGVSFKDDKHILTFDHNKNNDFSDDDSLFFDKDFAFLASDTHKIDSLPVYDFSLGSGDNKIVKKISIHPSQDEFSEKLRLMAQFKDYWQGDFSFNSAKYDVAIQGLNNANANILIKSKKQKFSKKHAVFNYNFSYKIKDTIKIDNALFVLDSLYNKMSKLTLTKINLKPEEFFSDKMGYKLFDFKLADLDNKEFKISQISNKEFVLLDFWGTWCKPCLALTPQLKQLTNKHENVDIISIAYDKDIEDVKNYIDSNGMNWYHSFIDRKSRQGSIISKLSIKNYPTFILLDKQRRIIYRASGEKSFTQIQKIISGNSKGYN